MRHNKKQLHIGKRDKDHRTAVLRNLAMAVIIYEKVKTTKAKAKAVAPFIDKLINVGKKENKMNAIREIEKLLQHDNSSRKIMEELVQRYSDRNSGYTRTTNLGFRKGDAAPVVQIELV